MPGEVNLRAMETADDLVRLRAFVVAEGGAVAERILDRHLARPRYQADFTHLAEQSGALIGYALIGHERRRLGAAALDASVLENIYVQPHRRRQGVFRSLMGNCLRTLAIAELPLVTLHGPQALFAPFGFTAYQFNAIVTISPKGQLVRSDETQRRLRPVVEGDLEDLAALYEANYHDHPLTPIRAATDWRVWPQEHALVLEDRRGRVVAYAALAVRAGGEPPQVVEAAAADGGAARNLIAALLARTYARGPMQLELTLPPTHMLALAALYMGGATHITAALDDGRAADDVALAGVVDLPAMLSALTPEFERRLTRSRYAGWSGNVRIEIETGRVTLAILDGRVEMVDGSRPADVRLRRVTLATLAQLCLGYRAAADLRATGGLECDDSALGLIDALFPVVMPYEQGKR
jgi:predicted N-acetyltransferase YhbS